jgi:hypothetical protein
MHSITIAAAWTLANKSVASNCCTPLNPHKAIVPPNPRTVSHKSPYPQCPAHTAQGQAKICPRSTVDTALEIYRQLKTNKVFEFADKSDPMRGDAMGSTQYRDR